MSIHYSPTLLFHPIPTCLAWHLLSRNSKWPNLNSLSLFLSSFLSFFLSSSVFLLLLFLVLLCLFCCPWSYCKLCLFPVSETRGTWCFFTSSTLGHSAGWFVAFWLHYFIMSKHKFTQEKSDLSRKSSRSASKQSSRQQKKISFFINFNFALTKIHVTRFFLSLFSSSKHLILTFNVQYYLLENYNF